jgi:hypothetical protein
MNNSTDRKSMDDVLASIRRIVRAEKEPETQPASRDAPRGQGWTEDEPLALTPDMRSDSGSETGTVDPEAIARPAAPALPPAPAEGGEAAMPDRETLRRMVREILADELTNGSADQTVREIIRDELMNGEIGGNISQNVARLIRAEVAKALENR